MIRFSTRVDCPPLPVKASLKDKIMVLGSCFADGMGERLKSAGFDVCVNPFGTLYNPVSIANSVARMQFGKPFEAHECVEMGAGDGRICSWWHHTSFARRDADDFLKGANDAFEKASAFWKSCNKVIITLGTAMVWRKVSDCEVVSNCLKRPAAEFSHELLSVSQVADILSGLVRQHPLKEFIFTVSPIRHMGDGAHANSVSKSTLILAIEDLISREGSRCCYFPAYEILLDELRDYRFYAEDLLHPSKVAEDYIWQHFLEAGVPKDELAAVAENEKAARKAAHRVMSE